MARNDNVQSFEELDYIYLLMQCHIEIVGILNICKN